MIPMRHSSIFKSRWMALVWAAGIIWFAMDVAGTPESSAQGTDNAAGDGASQEFSQSDADALNKFLK
ncbi:MAG: hypothetical protein ABIO29_04085 [Sphingomicrobium sp.]